jgi:predicted nucleotidyltransferase component of viral defense system
LSPDLAASARARLLARAKAEREEYERMLVRYAAERVLYRLGASPARERCILKGASLLTVWMSDRYRATRDIDVLCFGPSNEAAIRALVEEICAVPCPEDGLRFDLSGLVVEDIRAHEEYVGKRARLLAFLGTARIRVQIDFGFGDALVVGPDEIEIPTLLKGLPAPRLRAYSRETAVAEKFEAMVKLDIRNSRMKDFHDVWALAGAFSFDGPLLKQAIVSCFERRGTPWTDEIPRVLMPAFYQMDELQTRWRSYLAAGAVLVAPPERFEVIGERLMQFIGPVRRSRVEGEAFELAWTPGGPWR